MELTKKLSSDLLVSLRNVTNPDVCRYSCITFDYKDRREAEDIGNSSFNKRLELLFDIISQEIEIPN